MSFLATLILACLPEPASPAADGWLPTMGRLHLVVLHLPIGLFFATLALEVLARVEKSVQGGIALLLALSFWAALFSSVFGILLSWEGGYNDHSLSWHKWSGVAASGLILATNFLRSQRTPLHLNRFYTPVLALAAVAVFVAGHKGGSLTHGSDFLLERLPSNEAALIETASQSVYDTQIQPLFDDYCVSCHGPDKEKGELRLDSYEAAMAGGESGDAIIPGDGFESLTIFMMTLPLDDEDHMPPEEEKQPTEAQIALLESWIDSGAVKDSTMADLNPSSEP